jgi:RNA polymerase sigma-70 factor (ECF subfamily)
VPTDAELIARVIAGNEPQAFETLVRRHQSPLRHFVRRLSAGDHALADDVTQETFWLAYQNLARFRGDASFSTWLHKIAYRVFLRMKERLRETMVPESFVEALGGTAPASAEADLLAEQLMRHLSVPERLVITLSYAEGYSQAEIAEVAGMPLGTVKSHHRRGKEKLRRLLRKASGESTCEESC